VIGLGTGGHPLGEPPEFEAQKNPVNPLEEQRKLLYGVVLEWKFIKYSVFKIASEDDMKELEDVYTKCMNTKAKDERGYSFFSEKLVTSDTPAGDRIIVKWGEWEDLTQKKENTDDKENSGIQS
jgi:hypothetical protein